MDDDDDDYDSDEDLPLDMDGEMDMESMFAPAPDSDEDSAGLEDALDEENVQFSGMMSYDLVQGHYMYTYSACELYTILFYCR